MYIREGIRSIEDLKLSAQTKRKIYSGNALKLLRLPVEREIPRRPAQKK
jgi:predicted TIM-barrel fold metal-dependent hydrolase